FYFNFSSGSAVLLGSSEASPVFELGFFEYPHLSHCSWPCGCLFGLCFFTCSQDYYIENWSGIASNSWENYATSNLLSNLPVRSTEYVNYIPGVTISGPDYQNVNSGPATLTAYEPNTPSNVYLTIFNGTSSHSCLGGTYCSIKVPVGNEGNYYAALSTRPVNSCSSQYVLPAGCPSSNVYWSYTGHPSSTNSTPSLCKNGYNYRYCQCAPGWQSCNITT
ncbi:MAG: hypothetical protein QXN16_03695, partial [Candidatus Micrarchaeaceae archaeon]